MKQIYLLLIGVLIISCPLTLKGQFESEYFYTDVFSGRKGDVHVQYGSDSFTRMVSIATDESNACLKRAIVFDTDENGNDIRAWEIGDSTYNYWGVKVIILSTGKYVAIGYTDKDLTVKGTYTGHDCKTLLPYYNNFIAYIDPDSITTNWVRIFGEPSKRDYPVDILEDDSAHVVVMGITGEQDACYPCYRNRDGNCWEAVIPEADIVNGYYLTRFDLNSNMVLQYANVPNESRFEMRRLKKISSVTM